MKNSLEQSVTTTATAEDLKVIELIISKMSLFDGYYGEFTKLHAELKYKEYSTLSDDFKSFHRQIVVNAGKFSVSELASLKRSLAMLLNRANMSGQLSNRFYINFLEDAILNLDLWLDDVLEQIIADV